MRKPLLLLAALALLPLAPATAQRASDAPAAAPKLVLTPAQRAELQQAVIRGRMLAAIDQAGRISSSDARSRIPQAQVADVAGWIAEPEGNGIAVTYFTRAGDGFAALYRAQVLGGRVTNPQIFAPGSRPALTGAAARMAAARVAAGTVADNKVCNGPELNYLTLPASASDPVLVYQLSPRMTAGKMPAGGHYRVAVAADGSIAQSSPLAEACTDIAIPAVRPRQRPRPLVVNARSASLPNELHVFMALSIGRPLVVATGTDPVRLWGVTGEGIAELPQ